MKDIEQQFNYFTGCADWLDEDDGSLSRFTGNFEKAQFLETPCKVNDAFDAFNFLMGRHSYYHCRTQMPNHTIIGRHCSINALSLIGAVSHSVDALTTGCLDIEAEAQDEVLREHIFRPPPMPMTIIGCDVWIGANAVILQGCTIGHGACIAAGAVVTKPVEPYAIVAGVPAKVIRYRFDEETRRRLLRSPWWQLPEEVVKNLPRTDVLAALDIAENYWMNR